jgi:predicted RNA binding protein YcfA (HicA-like mRNA interferase family)
MGKLSNISGKEAVKAFEKLGWKKRGQVGSHVVMTKEGEKANLSVPQHKELAPGTLRKLIGYTGISIDDFLKLL